MSFRIRLTLFFFLIVVLPMVAIAVLFVEVSDRSRAGKADAQLATGLETALAEYEGATRQGRARAAALLADERFGTALAEGDKETAGRLAREAAGRRAVQHLRLTMPDGTVIEPTNADSPIAVGVATAGGDAEGARLELSLTGPMQFAERISDLTELDVIVVAEGGVLASTLPVTRGIELPPSGNSASTETRERTVRAAAADLPGDGLARVVLLAPLESEGFFGSSPRVAAALGAFLLLALGFVAFLVRSLQGQVATMLHAARRIGEGDFSQKVPVIGRDEMAGLAAEFNKMSDRLAEQVELLKRQRTEIDRSIQRLGQAFASGLDREALLGIVLETALGACEAEYGRIELVDEGKVEMPEGATDALREAAAAVAQRSRRDGVHIEAEREGAYALAAPLRPLGGGEVVGTMTVARTGLPFGNAERDVFLYLIGQASASLENISAHERVTEQASTDELTGLPNNRAFREVMERETARAERFGHDLSLILLDVDDFKLVNDTHGHLQGDEVLRAIGRILAEEPREIDEPARYGGEEFVVALPETDLQGAAEVAERIRARIEIEAIPMLGSDEVMYVSASFGVASMPATARNAQELIERADEALYAAKEAGKNRVVLAPLLDADATPAQGHADSRRT